MVGESRVNKNLDGKTIRKKKKNTVVVFWNRRAVDIDEWRRLGKPLSCSGIIKADNDNDDERI